MHSRGSDGSHSVKSTVSLVSIVRFGRGVYLLVDLQSINNRSQLAESFISLLMVFQLGRYQVCQVSQGLRSIENLSTT